MHVWLTQCLCPQRHTIMAAAEEVEDHDAAVKAIEGPLREKVAEFLETRQVNAWCGLCHASSETWYYETARTRFRTMEEAMPVLEQAQAQQIATGILIGELLGLPTRH